MYVRDKKGKLGFFMRELGIRRSPSPYPSGPSHRRKAGVERNHHDFDEDIMLEEEWDDDELEFNPEKELENEMDEVFKDDIPDKKEYVAREEKEAIPKPENRPNPRRNENPEEENEVSTPTPAVPLEEPSALSLQQKHKNYIDDFEKEISAMLGNDTEGYASQETNASDYMCESRKQTSGTTEPNGHQLFEDMAKDMEYANSFDLGTIQDRPTI